MLHRGDGGTHIRQQGNLPRPAAEVGVHSIRQLVGVAHKRVYTAVYAVYADGRVYRALLQKISSLGCQQVQHCCFDIAQLGGYGYRCHGSVSRGSGEEIGMWTFEYSPPPGE